MASAFFLLYQQASSLHNRKSSLAQADADSLQTPSSSSLPALMRWLQASEKAKQLRRGLAKEQDDMALILRCDHWLEAADPKHRYGTNLSVYFAHWIQQCELSTLPAAPSTGSAAAPEASNSSSSAADVEHSGDAAANGDALLPTRSSVSDLLENPASQQASRNFFQWLDYGPGSSLDLEPEGISRQKLESQQVVYLTEEQLQAFEVIVNESGLLQYKQSGQLLDTSTDTLQGGVQPVEVSSSSNTDSAFAAVEGPHKVGKWIYVLDPHLRLYVHPKIRGRFHHSSFLQGGAVLSAGALKAVRGKLLKITADSGHYQPSPEHFERLLQHLQSMGADTKDVSCEFRSLDKGAKSTKHKGVLAGL